MTPEILQTLGHYQVRRELARGGMGVVYHAWDPHLERDVAIKMIHVDGITPEDLERLSDRRELLRVRLREFCISLAVSPDGTRFALGALGEYVEVYTLRD